MTVNVETPAASSIANGVTTVFPHSFTVLSAADLVVTGVLDGALTTYALGVHYTVAGVGSSSGSVTFLSAPASGTVITRYRDTALKRSIDYQNNGDLLAATLNADFDRVWLALQEIFAGGKGSPGAVRAPNGESIPALPTAANRAGMFLAFDGSGDPVVAYIGDGTAASLAAYLARGLAIDGSDNVVANVRVQSPRFEATNTDDTGTPDAAFRANRVLSTGVLDGHGFRDQTTFSRVANSYAAFDAAITSTGSGTNDHIAGFQARPTVSRSGGTLLHVYNFVSAPTLSSGNATNNYGLFCFNPVGAGTVAYNYGLYVPQQSKGSISNHAIYVAQGGHQVFLGADTQINQLLRVGTAQLILGGSTTSDYPYVGYNYEPTTGKYQASDIAVATKFDTSGFRVFTAPSGTAGAACTLTQRWQVSMAGDVVQNVNTSAPALGTNGQMVFALTSNTNLRVSVRGSDGVTRVANLTLA